MAITHTGPSLGMDPPYSGMGEGNMWWDPQSFTLNTLGQSDLTGVDPKTAYALAQYFGNTHAATVAANAKIITEPATAFIREAAAKNRELAGIKASGEQERWTQSDKQQMDAWTLLGQHRDEGRGQIGAEGTEQRETQEEAAEQKQEQSALEALIQMGGQTAGGQDFGTGIMGTESKYAKELEETRGQEAQDLEGKRGLEERLTLAERIKSELGTATGEGSYQELGSIGAKAAAEGFQRREDIRERATEGRTTMGEHASLLGTQADSIMGKINQVSNPFNNLVEQMGGMNNIISQASQGRAQPTAMNLLNSMQNPLSVNPMQAAAMTGGGIGGLQGAFNASNALNQQAAGQFGKLLNTAGQNVAGQYSPQIANQFAVQRPITTALGQNVGALGQAIGGALGMSGQVGMV